MARSSKPRRMRRDVSGLKLFITAASLTATVGGWAAYSRHEVAQVAAPPATDQATQNTQPTAPQESVLRIADPVLPALPTLVPTPDPAVIQALLQGGLQDRTSAPVQRQAPPTKAAQATPTPTSLPAQVKKPLPPLRSVQRPATVPNRAPAPVTSSRSSRP